MVYSISTFTKQTKHSVQHIVHISNRLFRQDMQLLYMVSHVHDMKWNADRTTKNIFHYVYKKTCAAYYTAYHIARTINHTLYSSD